MDINDEIAENETTASNGLNSYNDVLDNTNEGCSKDMDTTNTNDEETSSDDDTSSSDSDDDKEKICISYSNFKSDDIKVVKQFYEMFDVRVSVDWSDRVTHLIVKLNSEGFYERTQKCINALVSNCYIVSMKWIEKSVREKKIQPEETFVPLDACGEAVAMKSWRIGKGLENSSMLWTKHWALYFHPLLQSHNYFADYKKWALKVGFIIIEQIKDFKNVASDMQIVLTGFMGLEKEINAELTKWFMDYQCIAVDIKWLFEVLCRYRCVRIESQFLVTKLSDSMMEWIGIVYEHAI